MAYNEKDFQTALVCGLMSKGRELKGTPIAYLYNGVQLPGLPEWDKSKYPYALVISDGSDDGSVLYLLSEKAGYRERTTDNGAYYEFIATAETDLFVYNSENGSAWEYLVDYSTGKNDEIIGGYKHFYAEWSNHDILNTDGTIYLSASEPVPVYE